MKVFEPRHDKTNKMNVRPAKTQISLRIRLVWVAKVSRFLHADSEDSCHVAAHFKILFHTVVLVLFHTIVYGTRGLVYNHVSRAFACLSYMFILRYFLSFVLFLLASGVGCGL